MNTHIILVGKPGSGKGTMSKKIIESNKNYVHLSTGDVFREHMRKKTALGLEILDVMNSGELVNDELTIAVVESFINEHFNSSIIFDGFPRNIKQAEWLIDELQSDVFDLLNIDVSDDLAKKRITNRALFENRKEDNNIDAISKRLRDYEELTKPIIEWYDNASPVDAIIINGNLDANKCFKEIKKKLGL